MTARNYVYLIAGIVAVLGRERAVPCRERRHRRVALPASSSTVGQQSDPVGRHAGHSQVAAQEEAQAVPPIRDANCNSPPPRRRTPVSAVPGCASGLSRRRHETAAAALASSTASPERSACIACSAPIVRGRVPCARDRDGPRPPLRRTNVALRASIRPPPRSVSRARGLPVETGLPVAHYLAWRADQRRIHLLIPRPLPVPIAATSLPVPAPPRISLLRQHAAVGRASPRRPPPPPLRFSQPDDHELVDRFRLHQFQPASRKLLSLEDRASSPPCFGSARAAPRISSTDNVASAWDENWRTTNRGTDSPNDRNGFASGGPRLHGESLLCRAALQRSGFPRQGARVGAPLLASPARRMASRSPPARIAGLESRTRMAAPATPSGRTSVRCATITPNMFSATNGPIPTPAPGLMSRRPWRNISASMASNGRLRRGALSMTKMCRPGQWLKYDEQAVIYTALHQMKNAPSLPTCRSRKRPSRSTTRTVSNSNKKKVDASKG